ncbi:armadillo-type protein [Pyronema domesticum]|uniref:Similar to Probable importin subunit beta-4 acc. no. O60100 n=1 Tax=Pyronema omphalodes (strain CBS 100304) TaxID=1076935 RepID=U4LNT6_PYROM|nr:armadillo-type protein [Pyronema domesticum]CCX30995.1 Similar to Probable importin subunit beta-4; acc. no. O60100 [Pyronema omphalodes CBS 100304]
MDYDTFVRTLEVALSPNTSDLARATEELQNYYKNPESLALLVQVISRNPDERLRQLSAVQARTLVAKFWGVKNNAPSKIPDDVKAQIKEALLVSATQDTVTNIRHSSARVVSAIAKIELPAGLWQELPATLAQAATSQKVEDREVSTYILFTLLETLEDEIANRWKDFLSLFAQTISDPESVQVRLNTLLALGKLSEILNSDEHPQAIDGMKQLIPAMVAVLKQVAEDGDEEKSNAAFEVFQMLLIVDPAITSTHFRDLVQFFSDLSVDPSPKIDDDTRVKALSFLLSCMRYKKMKIQALRVGESLTLRAMEIVTRMDEVEDSDDMTPGRTALQLLDFMASALPPSMVVVPLLNALPSYVQDADPKRRKAGILSLGHCVEGAPDFVVTQLQVVLPVVLQLLNDQDSSVRKAALEALMQLADDLHEELGKEHGTLVPILINMLDSNDGPETWRRACNAIDALLVGVEEEDVQAYLPTLIPKLQNMFMQEDFKLKSAAVGGIGSTALAAKGSFTPYFQGMMQGLIPFVEMKHSEEELDLRGIVIDCMGSMAEAVGLQTFAPYVQPLMQAAQDSIHLGHPRMKETAFMFFGTIAKIYGEEFQPFLGDVTKALFESLNQAENDDFEEGEISKIISLGTGDNKTEISGELVNMEDDDDEDDEDNWDELTSVSAVAFEKEVAAETLGEILSNCKHAYIPFLKQTVEILKDKSTHVYEGVRKASVGTLWRAYATLWQVCEEKGTMQKWAKGLPLQVAVPGDIEQLGAVVTDATIEVLKVEMDRSTVSHIFQNIAETLKLCGPAILADADGNTILELTTQIVLVLTKQHPAQLDDVDDEEIPDLQESAEYDWLLIDSSMDVLLGLAVALGPQYGDVWKIVSQHVIKYASSTDPRERSTAVGVIADSIKFMESAVTQHTEKLLKLLVHRLNDEDQDTKANAAYAIGLLCLYSEDRNTVLGQYNTILQQLHRFLNRTPEDNPRLLDNAAGCLSRMIMASPEAVPLDSVLPALMTVLPLQEDYEENEPVYKSLVKLYQLGNQTVFGLTGQLVPVLDKVLNGDEGQLDDATRAEVVELLRFIASKDASVIQAYPGLVARL